VLWLVIWASKTFYLLFSSDRGDFDTRLGGIRPTLSLVAGSYALLSFAAMVAHALIPTNPAASRVHWIVQILLFGGLVRAIVYLFSARAAHIAGVGQDGMMPITPRDLHSMIAAQERGLSSDSCQSLKQALRDLRELVLYSLHESAELGKRNDYISLCQEIRRLCNDIATMDRSSAESGKRCEEIQERVVELIAKARQVAIVQVRR